jgi:metal-dependent amidase/aminoacylase/carboxypeptidase family protein
MQMLKQDVSTLLSEICPKYKLPHTAKWFDYFPKVVNDDFCNQVITEAAKTYNYDIINKSVPFRFGEDFGWYSQRYKAAMFGIGAGIQSPALHHANYDFPDETIETGMNMFQGIIKRILTHQL